MPFTELEKAIVRELQGTIPLDTLHPYEVIARRVGITEEELHDIFEEVERSWYYS